MNTRTQLLSAPTLDLPALPPLDRLKPDSLHGIGAKLPPACDGGDSTINPATSYRQATQWLEPVQLSAGTLTSLAVDQEASESVLLVMERLEDDDYLVFLRDYYRRGLARYGHHWNYADLLTFLYATALFAQPRSYLEIGVRRGRSMAVVASVVPHCKLVGFDMWVQDYAGMPNPGPTFVQKEMAKVGHRGELELISGDSHQTVPAYLAANPHQYFDAINVDGDHSLEGARADLEQVLPRLSEGGVVVLDDIVHPQHPYLETLWDEMIGADSNYSSAKYRALGYGVAVAVRKK